MRNSNISSKVSVGEPNSLTNKLHQLCPEITFKVSDEFYWSPKEQTIYYEPDRLNNFGGQWTLLHEVSHARLKHQDYSSDLELLIYEVIAWKEAVNIAPEIGLKISEEHIERCLDTYRNWLYTRSTCPKCQLNGLQTSSSQYLCLNCLSLWRVSPSRFCRPYRRTVNSK